MSTNRGVIDMTKLRGVKITLSGNLLGDVLDMLAEASVAATEKYREALGNGRDSAAAFWQKERDRYQKSTRKIYDMIRSEKRKAAR